MFFGPPGTGKTHLATGSASGPAKPATGSRSPPPPNGSPASATPTTQGRLHDELTRLGRIPLLVIDEVGYIPFEAEAANLFFQLVSARYERASVIVTSNKPFGRWGEVFGDATVAAAMIDRLVHHAEVVNLKGDSYRLKDRDLGRMPTNDDSVTRQGGSNFRPSQGGQDSAVVDTRIGPALRLWWRGEDLNLRPSGYETYSFRPTGLYGLIEFVRFSSLPGEM